MDSRTENKNFPSILQFNQEDTLLRLVTPQLVETAQEGYKIELGWDFSAKFGELIGWLLGSWTIPSHLTYGPTETSK